MPTLRIIGDAHGKVEPEEWSPSYFGVLEECEFSVQVGDMGDAETYAVLDACVDPGRHRFLGGNHDDYWHLPKHSLGDFGTTSLGGVEFFFVRGALSVDKELRLRQEKERGWKLWHAEEELSEEQLQAAHKEYTLARPRIMLSHTAPTTIARRLCEAARLAKRGASAAVDDRTGRALEAMLETHAPSLWVFGHFHQRWTLVEGATRFVCLPELGFVDVDENGQLIS